MGCHASFTTLLIKIIGIMTLFRFSNFSQFDPLNLVESGMGYQIFEDNQDEYVVIDSQYFILLREISVSPYPITFENLLEINNVENKTVRNQIIKYKRNYSSPSSQYPPFTDFTNGTEVFIRYSAFNPDKRIKPDGSVIRGTYCTTLNDDQEVPSGLAAVGRYALPSRLSHIYAYEIRPPKDIPIYFGTVTPNYGLAGGGVEVFFPDGCPEGSASFSPSKTIPLR